jgi:hypothetical protein
MRALAALVALLAAAAATAQLPLPTTGDLLVSSTGNHRLLRLGFDGRQLAELTLPGLVSPRGIAVRPAAGEVYLVSEGTAEVLVLDRALQVARRFPTVGVASPTSAAFGPSGDLFVAGFNSSNVGRFRTDGTPLGTFSAPGQLVNTNCVMFRADGGSYTASAANGSVVEFDAAGTFVRRFTGFGLSSTMGLAVWNGELFAAGGGSNNIVVFDLAGTPLREIRHPDLAGPQSIAFRGDGTFVVSGFYNHRIAAFRADGAHLWTVQPPGSSVPRGAAFLPGCVLDVPPGPVLGAPFAMPLESPFEPGLTYLCALSVASSPGLPLPDGRVWPLASGGLLQASLFGGPPLFTNFVGVLDARGTAAPTLFLPDWAFLRGLSLWTGALTLEPTPLTIRQIAASRLLQL